MRRVAERRACLPQFNHVHVPDFASESFCNVTLRGRFGDALLELDSAVGDTAAAC